MGSALSPRDAAAKAADRPRQITIVLYLALVGSGIALFGLTANLLSAGSETVLEQARESGALDDISASEFVTRIRVIAGIGIALSAVAIAAAVSMAKRTPRARVVLTTTAAIAVAFSLWMGPIGVPWLFMCVTSIWLLWSRPSTAWLTGERAQPASA